MAAPKAYLAKILWDWIYNSAEMCYITICCGITFAFQNLERRIWPDHFKRIMNAIIFLQCYWIPYTDLFGTGAGDEFPRSPKR